MSKKVVSLEGRVSEVKICGSKNEVEVKINPSRRKPRDVRIPVTVRNEFELMPYELALLGNAVRFREETSTHHVRGSRCEIDYDRSYIYTELEILDGPLKGHRYVRETGFQS